MDSKHALKDESRLKPPAIPQKTPSKSAQTQPTKPKLSQATTKSEAAMGVDKKDEDVDGDHMEGVEMTGLRRKGRELGGYMFVLQQAWGY